MQPITVSTPDGLTIAAGEWGNPSGPEILFIHGFSQCSLSWERQLSDSTLGQEFRMIAYDLRGHGASDKPSDKGRYSQDRLWADELAAVIAAARLRRPVLVGWSYAGRVITDYVRFYGIEALAGINFVAAVTKSGNEFLGSDIKHLGGMQSDDLATNIVATRTFLRACVAEQPSTDQFEVTLAFSMMVPARIRAAVLSRTPNPGDVLPRLTLPVLVSHGTQDRVILKTLGEYTASAAPNATLSLYDGIGHLPFWENASRFNHELAGFVRAANGAARA
jgi:pimeloyl-ACP methyl ester carboxylesterase